MSSETLYVCPAVRMIADGEGAIVFDPERDRVHLLNQSAAILLLLCDGARDIDQLIATAVSTCPERPEDEARADFVNWLRQAESDGLLVRGAGGGELQALCPQSLADLAERLYDEGDYQSAYRCQRLAVELLPGNSDLWFTLGEVAHAVGDFSAARSAYERYLEAHPENAEVAHLVIALGAGPTPPRASNECITQTFDEFAESFDERLLNDLGYRGHTLLLERLREFLPPPAEQFRIADLGCGTGLAGRVFKPWARRLVGVDLSSQMAARACATGVYNAIHLADLTDWLQAVDQSFDVMLASDVLIYIGDLAPVFQAASRALNPSGLLAFSVERAADNGFCLTASGRYAHHADYVESTAREAGLAVVHLSEAVIRTEYERDVVGLIVVFRR